VEKIKNWRLYNGTKLNWQEQVLSFDNSTYLHDNGWAKHLENIGWQCYRWEYKANDKSIGYIQGFLKRYPFGIGVMWFPDWIIGNYELSYELIGVLKKSLSLRFITIRVRSNHLKNEHEFNLLKKTLSISSRPFGSSLKMNLDLSKPTEELHKGLTKNWRRNLNRSKKLDYEIVEVVDSDIIANLYSNMSKAKGLKKIFYSKKQIESIMISHKDNIIVLGAKTENGDIQAIRGAIIRGNEAIDIFAATNAFSRKHYLSYALCWDLLKRCKALGCEHFDFSGVDPENNVGVYNFKKGTGAKLVEILGEFEYSNSQIINKAVELASRWRN